MSDMLKTIIALDTLDKLETNKRTISEQQQQIDQQNHALDRQKFAAEQALQQQKASHQRSSELTEEKNQRTTARQEVELREARMNAEQERRRWNNLLCQPFDKIGEHHKVFKLRYEELDAMLAQMAIYNSLWKEIAERYGKALGKDPQLVFHEMDSLRDALFSGQSEFDNNLDPSLLNSIQRHADNEQIRDQILEEEVKKQARADAKLREEHLAYQRAADERSALKEKACLRAESERRVEEQEAEARKKAYAEAKEKEALRAERKWFGLHKFLNS